VRLRSVWLPRLLEQARPLAALAAVAAPAFDTFTSCNAGNDERGEWVGPPPTCKRVREQAYEQRDRQVRGFRSP